MTPSDVSTPSAKTDVVPRRRIVILICLAVSAGTGLAWFLEGTGLQSFPGSIEARTTLVTTNRAARVDDVSVKTGQTVVPGDTLFQLVDSQLEDRLIGKRREIAQREAEVGHSKAIADVELAWRRRELQADIFETQLKVAALSQEKLNKQVEQIAWRERLTSVEVNLSPLISDANHPFRSISQELHTPDDRRLQAMLREDAAAASAEALATQIALCEQRLKKLELLDKEIEAKVRASSGIDLAETRFNGVKQELAALESQMKELTITSPTYGTIGVVKLQSGDRVPQGGPLVEILDDQQPHIVARIPSSEASKLRQGSKVTLIFPADQRRIGIIAAIPPQTMSVAGASESILAVKIEPASKLWPKLPIGSNVKVLLP